jgi:hypothetical protein
MTFGWGLGLSVTLSIHPSSPDQSYNNSPAASLHLYNNGHAIRKTPSNALQTIDLLSRC